MLGIVCGALHVADASFRKSMSDFLHSLERLVDIFIVFFQTGQFLRLSAVFSRGQVLPAASLLNSVNVDLIYEGVKYCLKVSSSFFS